MHISKHCILILLMGFNALFSYAHQYPFPDDSITIATNEHVRFIEQKIGDADYHKFGNLVIERAGNTYTVILPVFKFMEIPAIYDSITRDQLPKNTRLTIRLDDGEIIISMTEQITAPWLYFQWHYNYPDERTMWSSYRNGVFLYTYHDKNTLINIINSPLCDTRFDYYGLSWKARFPLTTSDILLMNRHKIVEAFIEKDNRKIVIPIKNKQAKKIRHAIRPFIS